MRTLIDTNILVRSVQRNHPASSLARQALISLYRNDCSLFVTPQNVAEFWNVCTRPNQANGLGLSVSAASRHVDRLQRFLVVLPDTRRTFQTWLALVVEHAVVGVKVHDTRLVAAMKTYGVTRILTFNVRDFARFGGLEAIHPETLA